MKLLKVRGDHITLGQLLQVAGLANSGGEARLLLEQSPAMVNEESEQRRGRKLRPGDRVVLGDREEWLLTSQEEQTSGRD